MQPRYEQYLLATLFHVWAGVPSVAMDMATCSLIQGLLKVLSSAQFWCNAPSSLAVQAVRKELQASTPKLQMLHFWFSVKLLVA